MDSDEYDPTGSKTLLRCQSSWMRRLPRTTVTARLAGWKLYCAVRWKLLNAPNLVCDAHVSSHILRTEEEQDALRDREIFVQRRQVKLVRGCAVEGKVSYARSTRFQSVMCAHIRVCTAFA